MMFNNYDQSTTAENMNPSVRATVPIVSLVHRTANNFVQNITKSAVHKLLNIKSMPSKIAATAQCQHKQTIQTSVILLRIHMNSIHY